MTTPDVVVVAHSASRSGAEKVLLRYVDALLDADFAVEAVCPDGAMRADLDRRRVSTTTIAELHQASGSKLVAGAVLARRWVGAARAIRRASRCGPGDRPPLVIVNSVLALPATRLAGCNGQALWLVHDVIVRPELRLLARAATGGLLAAVAVSGAAGALARRLGVTTHVVRNGTDWPVEPVRSGSRDGSCRPVVGINAIVTPWKGHRVLLDAAAGLPEVDVEIMGGTFANDGPFADELRARAAEPDLRGRVRFLGHVDDPLEAMRSWTVAVSASVDPEAGPLAVLEAMSLGVPVVATDHGGASEVLGDAGLLVAPANIEAMRTAIVRLVDDEQLWRRCSEAGPVIVADGLTNEASCRAFIELVERYRGRP